MLLKRLGMYTGFITNSIKVQYAYRFQAFVFVLHDLFTMLIQYYLWVAIFSSSSGSMFDISLNTYVTYILIGLIVKRATTCVFYGEVFSDIKSGKISVYLTKPYSYPMMIFNRHIGYTIGSCISLIPLLLIIIIFFDFQFTSPSNFLLFLLSLFFAYFNMFFLTLCFGLIGFWIINYWGLNLLRRNLILVFSGELIALDLLMKIGSSEVAQTSVAFLADWKLDSIFYIVGLLSYCLPFQTIGYTPSGIYSGLISGQQELLLHFGLQVFWLIVLFLICRWLWNKATKIITVFGG